MPLLFNYNIVMPICVEKRNKPKRSVIDYLLNWEVAMLKEIVSLFLVKRKF